MLTGTFVYGMDRKGRLVMPSAFRSHLGSSFVLTRAPGQCLLATSCEQWRVLEERYEQSLLFKGYFLSQATECRLDATTGRFLVPHVLRDYAELRPMEEVAICGIGRAIQISTRGRFETFLNESDFPHLGQLEEDLAIPRLVQAGRFRLETHDIRGINAIHCTGRLDAAAVRQLSAAVERAARRSTSMIVLDVRDSGEAPSALGLLFSMTAECRERAEMQLWVVADCPVPAARGVRDFRSIEQLFWSLDESPVSCERPGEASAKLTAGPGRRPSLRRGA